MNELVSIITPSYNTAKYIGETIESVQAQTSFASNIHYYGANHPVEYASCSPYFYNKSFGYQVRDVKREELQIGNDVWIGANVIITKNCFYIGSCYEQSEF